MFAQRALLAAIYCSIQGLKPLLQPLYLERNIQRVLKKLEELEKQENEEGEE